MSAKEIIFGWPDRALHPNERVHWSKKAVSAKAARRTAFLLAFEAGWKNVQWPEGRLHLWITFFPPDRRRRDDDGLLTSFKPFRDGIADLIGIDDNRFVSHPLVSEEIRVPGQMVVRITGGPDAD